MSLPLLKGALLFFQFFQFSCLVKAMLNINLFYLVKMCHLSFICNHVPFPLGLVLGQRRRATERIIVSIMSTYY